MTEVFEGRAVFTFVLIINIIAEIMRGHVLIFNFEFLFLLWCMRAICSAE